MRHIVFQTESHGKRDDTDSGAGIVRTHVRGTDRFPTELLCDRIRAIREGELLALGFSAASRGSPHILVSEISPIVLVALV